MGEKGIFSYVALNLKKMFKDITSGDKERFKRQFANLLTLTRGVLAPIFVVIFLCTHSLKFLFITILLSALTDCFDGWYARSFGYVSEFGALLDTVCDKVFIICIILPIMTLILPKTTKSLPLFIIILILEVIISIINVYSKLMKKQHPKSSLVGKIKTVVLDVTLVICYLSLILNINKIVILVFLSITIVMQIIAGIDYLIKAIKVKK